MVFVVHCIVYMYMDIVLVLKIRLFVCFLKVKVSVFLHIFFHLWNRITSLWMNRCLKKVAWRFRLFIILQVIVPLSPHNKESLALAVPDDTKKLSASQVPTYQEAIGAVCKNSVPFRSDAWRETRYLTGRSICVDTPCAGPRAHLHLQLCCYMGGI